MWVLEARADAEKIWYPVVWEKIKDADNVIDYDIREEITKDVSAEINANNQTTTGMATVIPWVNAPKLIESTSIISSPTIWYISTDMTFTWRNISEWRTSTIVELSDQMWTPPFTTVIRWENNSRVKIPADWVYELAKASPARRHISAALYVTSAILTTGTAAAVRMNP